MSNCEDSEKYTIEDMEFPFSRDYEGLFTKNGGLSMRNLKKWRFHKMTDQEVELTKFLIEQIYIWEDIKYEDYQFHYVEKWPQDEHDLEIILSFTNQEYEWRKDEYIFTLDKKFDDPNNKCWWIHCTAVLIGEYDSDYED